ncbi:MAG: methyltransferase [Deltaproteobacteria bacterium]|nr:methyltransferase [Deltaproteobacteria bacterium]
MDVPSKEVDLLRIVKKYLGTGIIIILVVLWASTVPCYAQSAGKERTSDEKVKKFLSKMRNQWRDFNVPEADGKILHEIIIKNQYKKALEIGTSTGHSAIWMAWALSKTGGRLITVEFDEGRYRQALANFQEAGLDKYIDARLADAHQLVHELRERFDFIFIDADKDWYTNYAKALIPKLEPGGCITAHNVEEPRAALKGRYSLSGTEEYYEYMKSLPEFETRIHPKSRAGVAVSYKKKNK